MPDDPTTSDGSTQLRQLYLDETQAGIRWLHDPHNQYVRDVLGTYEQRRPDDRCDAGALAADIDDVLVLLYQRHIGIAEGEFAGPELDRRLHQWATAWRRRLEADRPVTWGDAIGLDGYHLRRILRDSHCNIRGEDRDRVAEADPRGREPRLVDPGPPVDVHSVGDVLCIRIRRLGGTPEDIEQLRAWAARHDEHFAADRIVVDLRGNGGGSDEYMLTWVRPHVPRRVVLSDEAYAWIVDDKPLNYWNQAIARHAEFGEPLDLHVDPTRTLRVERDRNSFEPGERPWRGRLLVVIDGAVASSGESATVFLRDGLGARIVGSPSAGLMLFGNVAPYVLPRSGLVLRLGSTRFGYPPVEFTGIDVDAPLPDPLMSTAQIAARFDELHAAAG